LNHIIFLAEPFSYNLKREKESVLKMLNSEAYIYMYFVSYLDFVALKI